MEDRFFNRNRLKLKSISEKEFLLDINVIKNLEDVLKSKGKCFQILKQLANYIIKAKMKNKPVIFMIGAHVLRSGVQRFLIDLMKKGYISLIATNGACAIHDFEFSLIGKTTESVSKYISEGQFGLWKETGIINDIVNESFDKRENIGFGEVIGRYIEKNNLQYKDVSIYAWGYKLGIPITVHVGIGYDIIHELPNFRGDSTGSLSYLDFLKFVSVVENIEGGGVIANFGSSIMAPEIFLKALSMARNIAHQEGKKITDFITLVCDLHNLPKDFHKEPDRDSAYYYYRPWKTMLVRTVKDGGKSFYVRGKHSDTIPLLWKYINEKENI